MGEDNKPPDRMVPTILDIYQTEADHLREAATKATNKDEVMRLYHLQRIILDRIKYLKSLLPS